MQLVTNKVKMTLVGLDGNAFYLMGAFSNKARHQGVPKDEIDKVLAECKKSDYNHLLCTLLDNIEDDDYEEEEDYEDEY